MHASSPRPSFPGTRTLLEIVRSGRVEGLDFGANDVIRAVKVYGPALEAIRGKTTRVKRGAVSGERAKVVDADLVMHVDIAFFAKIPFLISFSKPLGLVMADWIKSREVKDVKDAILRQQGKLASEGFHVVEVRSDGEGAIGAIAEELHRLGIRVSIHAPNTYSAEVDAKIKQIKNGVRAATSLPYLFPLMLLAWAVFYAVHKINLMPSSVNAHNYSPMEMFLGRSISMSRDLGARHGGRCLAFGSSEEAHSGTTNSMADRTRPGIWLGAKSNSYGSGYIFLTDTRKVVSRDQWKGLPMTSSVCERMNAIARAGQYLSMRGDIGEAEVEDDNALDIGLAERVVTPSESDSYYPTAGVGVPTASEIVRADDAQESLAGTAGVQIVAEDEPLQYEVVSDPSGGAQDIELSEAMADGEPGSSAGSWHDSSAGISADGEQNVVEPPWSLAGQPLRGGEEGRKRERRPVQRYGFSAVAAPNGGPSPSCARVGASPERRVYPVVASSRRELSSPVIRSRPSPGAIAYKERRLSREAAYLASFSGQRTRLGSAFVITTKAALKTFGQVAEDSMLKELRSVHGKRVIVQRRLSELSEGQRN